MITIPGLAVHLDRNTHWTLLVILWETTAVGVVLSAWRSWRVQSPARLQHAAAVLALTVAIVIAVATPVALLSMPARPAASSVAGLSVAAPVLRDAAGGGQLGRRPTRGSSCSSG